LHVASVFIAAFVGLFLLMDRSVNVYDEGIILTGSMLVHSGQIIHRDFYANYGPAEFYLLSWLYHLFGQHIIVERMLDLSCRAAILAQVYVSCLAYANRRMALITTFACFLWLGTIASHGYPVFPAMLCSLVSTGLLVKAIAVQGPSWKFFLAGLLAAVTVLCRYDIGAAIFVVHALYAGGILIVERERRAIGRVMRGTGAWAYLAGFGVPLACLVAFYARYGVLGDLVYDVVSFPSKFYPSMRGLPFPRLNGAGVLEGFARLAIYLPIMINGVIGACWIADKTLPAFTHGEANGQRRHLANDPSRWVAALMLMSCLFYLKGAVRVSVLHMQLGLVPSVMALAIYTATRKRRHWSGIVLAGLVVLMTMTAAAYALRRINHVERVMTAVPWLLGYARGTEGFVIEKTPADRLSGNRLDSLITVEPARENALDYVARHARQNDRVFVGLSRHDTVFINDVSAYFMLGRLPATKWHHVDPGLQTSQAIQTQMVAELDHVKPEYVWLESTWEDHREPNQSIVSSGVRLLDTYIATHYVPVQSFAAITILRRK
jgi:hypothetical protein